MPLIAVYEVGGWVLRMTSPEAAQDSVVAFHLLQLFFRMFGSTCAWMPGLAVVVILLCTHIASRQPWRISGRSVGLMYVEALALAVPLLAFNYVMQIAPLASGSDSSLLTDAVLGIGAGVYEELVFRLMLISILVMLGTDFLHLPSQVTTVAAVILSALAFSAHHHPPLGGEPFSADTFMFRSVAGLYLGGLFVVRGYGPAAGVHAAYNLLVMLCT